MSIGFPPRSTNVLCQNEDERARGPMHSDLTTGHVSTMYRVLSVLVIALLVAGMPAQAQIGETSAPDRSGLMVQARAGLMVPRVTSQFQNFYSVGRGVGAGVGYNLTPFIDVFVHGHYSQFVLDEGGVDGIFPEFDESVEGITTTVDATNGSILSGSLNFRFRTRLSEQMNLHLIGGVGAYHQSLYGGQLSFTNEQQGNGDTFNFAEQEQTSPGLTFGVELATPVSDQLQVSLMPTFVLIFGEPAEDEVPREQTGRVGFFSVDVGISWAR